MLTLCGCCADAALTLRWPRPVQVFLTITTPAFDPPGDILNGRPIGSGVYLPAIVAAKQVLQGRSVFSGVAGRRSLRATQYLQALGSVGAPAINMTCGISMTVRAPPAPSPTSLRWSSSHRLPRASDSAPALGPTLRRGPYASC